MVADEHGHSIESHTGDLAGTGPSTLEALILRSDLLIVVTDVNSHGAVWQARRMARRHPCALVFVRKLGVARLRQLVDAHGGRSAAQTACAAGG
jgi:hypothetical protein